MRNLTEPWRDVPGAPTVQKAAVTNALTGQPIQPPGAFSPQEMAMGAGMFGKRPKKKRGGINAPWIHDLASQNYVDNNMQSMA